MLVYDVTSEKSFDNIRNWIRNIEEVCTYVLQSSSEYGPSNPDSVHFSEMSLFHCMQELFLGKEKTTLLERCPHFVGVTVPLERIPIPSLFSKLFISHRVCPVCVYRMPRQMWTR